MIYFFLLFALSFNSAFYLRKIYRAYLDYLCNFMFKIAKIERLSRN
ncbi:hypothetical protein A1OE_952 [Candidatus Endolissoclinum faulkneri L2]|uniref:Uncharacterized protein n=1 Tax=Candidatus Endolissoclinum faulkneri L2 TaxID=1193729 RepID=K7YRF9_9PROT|nr:hypothetical protein A1OE_952 [Candidatus Endolissoclinum faulkneri L2]